MTLATRFHALARRALGSWSIVKTMGDGVLAVVADPVEAVVAVYGATVNTAAHLADAAGPGETLVRAGHDPASPSAK